MQTETLFDEPRYDELAIAPVAFFELDLDDVSRDDVEDFRENAGQQDAFLRYGHVLEVEIEEASKLRLLGNANQYGVAPAVS